MHLSFRNPQLDDSPGQGLQDQLDAPIRAALDMLYGAYISNKTRGCHLPKKRRKDVMNILGRTVYGGQCPYWCLYPGSCYAGDKCPQGASHHAHRPTVYAALLHRLPLDERPEVQVRQRQWRHCTLVVWGHGQRSCGACNRASVKFAAFADRIGCCAKYCGM